MCKRSAPLKKAAPQVKPAVLDPDDSEGDETPLVDIISQMKNVAKEAEAECMETEDDQVTMPGENMDEESVAEPVDTQCTPSVQIYTMHIARLSTAYGKF